MKEFFLETCPFGKYLDICFLVAISLVVRWFGGEVTEYLQIVECDGKSESGKNKGEERETEREGNAILRSYSLPTPALAVFLAHISLHRPTI